MYRELIEQGRRDVGSVSLRPSSTLRLAAATQAFCLRSGKRGPKLPTDLLGLNAEAVIQARRSDGAEPSRSRWTRVANAAALLPRTDRLAGPREVKHD